MLSDVFSFYSFVFRFVEAVRQAALAAVVTVKVAGHEHAGAALVSWTLATQTVDLAVFIHLQKYKRWDSRKTQQSDILMPRHCAHLVVLEHSQLDLLSLVLVLLWSGVRLLLPLFSTTTKSEHQVQRRLLSCRTQVYIHECISDVPWLNLWWLLGQLHLFWEAERLTENSDSGRHSEGSSLGMQFKGQSEHQNTLTDSTDPTPATTAHTCHRL